jgi:hypothetical protein
LPKEELGWSARTDDLFTMEITLQLVQNYGMMPENIPIKRSMHSKVEPSFRRTNYLACFENATQVPLYFV